MCSPMKTGDRTSQYVDGIPTSFFGRYSVGIPATNPEFVRGFQRFIYFFYTNNGTVILAKPWLLSFGQFPTNSYSYWWYLLLYSLYHVTETLSSDHQLCLWLITRIFFDRLFPAFRWIFLVTSVRSLTIFAQVLRVCATRLQPFSHERAVPCVATE